MREPREPREPRSKVQGPRSKVQGQIGTRTEVQEQKIIDFQRLQELPGGGEATGAHARVSAGHGGHGISDPLIQISKVQGPRSKAKDQLEVEHPHTPLRQRRDGGYCPVRRRGAPLERTTFGAHVTNHFVGTLNVFSNHVFFGIQYGVMYQKFDTCDFARPWSLKKVSAQFASSHDI